MTPSLALKATKRGGVTFRPFSVEYPHDGAKWSFEIQATSHEDAERRLASIAAWGKVDGEIMERIPATPGALWYVRLRCWWGNWRRGESDG